MNPIEKTKKINSLVVGLFLLLIVVVILAPTTWAIGRDSGAFLIGKQILLGKIPYKDMWDHKPPVIFFINAFGLVIGKGSLTGIWGLQVLGIFFAAFLGYALLYNAFGLSSAVCGSLSWLLMLVPLIEGGNLTEEYALLFQFWALFLYFTTYTKNSLSWKGYFIGCLFAITLFLQQNLISIFLCMMIFHAARLIFNKKTQQAFMDVRLIIYGFLTIVGVVLVYFLLNHALYDFIDATIVYNHYYLKYGFVNRLDALKMGLNYLNFNKYIVVGTLLYVLIVLKDFRHKNNIFDLMLFCLLGMVIEIFLSTSVGRAPPHYFMAWLPYLAVLYGFFFYVFIEHGQRFIKLIKLSIPKEMPIFILFVLLNVLVLVFNVDSLKVLAKQYPFSFQSHYQDMWSQINKLTSEKDYVLVWGAEGGINFGSRPSPSRYFYQYPLGGGKYSTPKRIASFLQEIKTKRPRIILDAHDSNLPSLDKQRKEIACGKSWSNDLKPGYVDIFSYIFSNYRYLGDRDGFGMYINRG